MRQLVAAILEILRSWWSVDRIRVSPREGRLLRMRPGSLVCVAGTTWEIGGRLVFEAGHGSLVRYECRAGDKCAELWVAVPFPFPADLQCRDAFAGFRSRIVTGTGSVPSDFVDSPRCDFAGTAGGCAGTTTGRAAGNVLLWTPLESTANPTTALRVYRDDEIELWSPQTKL